jgi:hypothetical protein
MSKLSAVSLPLSLPQAPAAMAHALMVFGGGSDRGLPPRTPAETRVG